jgi:hypothetical protein
LKRILFILSILGVTIGLSAQNRLDIESQLRKSVTPGSIIVTNASNNQVYVAPGSEGQILSIVSGLPTWAPNAGGGDGDCTEKIYAPAHGLVIGTRGFEMIHFTGAVWAYANTTTDILSHDAYLIEVPHVDSLLVKHCGYFERVPGDGLTAGTHYWLNDAGGVSSVADVDVDALICLAYADYVAFYPPRTFAGAGAGGVTLFQISDNSVFTNVTQGNIIRILDTPPFDISLSGLNYTLSWATPPTTGGSTAQVLRFNDVSDTYSWVTMPVGDQTVSITGAGINVVTGTYPNFTITGTEVDGSITNEKITSFSYSGGILTIIEGAFGNAVMIPDFVGATAGVAGVKGLVPAPAAGQQSLFLRGDGTWSSAGSGTMSSFIATDGTTPQTISDGNSLTFVDGGNFNFTTSATDNVNINWATGPTTGGATTQLLQFNDVGDTYSWINITSIQDQTVSITGAGISVVTGTYPTFTITSTEVDGSITNERITAHTYTASSGLLRITEGGTNFDVTLPAMVGATAGVAGVQGLVPAPAAGQQLSFLRGDGTWVVPSSTSQWTLTGTNLTPAAGITTTLSIGTATATAGKMLTVAGDVDIQGVLDPTKIIFSDGVTTTYNPATLNRYEVSFQGGRDLNFNSNTTANILHLENTGNVAIGGTNPTLAKLEVNGQIRMTTGAAVGHIITSDANGVMSWGAQPLDLNGMFGAANDGGTWAVDDFTTSATATFMSLGSDYTIIHGASDRVWRQQLVDNVASRYLNVWQHVGGNRVGTISSGSDDGFIIEGGPTFTLRARATTAADFTASVIDMIYGEQATNFVSIGQTTGSNLRLNALNHNAALTGTTLVKQASGNVLYEVPLAPSVLTGNVISPPSLAANVNDYAPASFVDAKILRLTSSANIDITGIAAGSVGRVVYVTNIGTSNIRLMNENTGSVAANRFALVNSANLTIRPNGGTTMWYDATSSRWRVLEP